MLKRVKYLFLLYLLWTLFFQLSKIIFLLYQHQQSFALPIGEWFGILAHGFRLDASAAAYILLLPPILLVILSLAPRTEKWISWALEVHFIMFLGLNCILLLADTVLYGFWGFRLDISPLQYLRTPGEAFASVSIGLIIGQLVFGAVLFYSFFILYRKWLSLFVLQSGKAKPFESLVYLLLAACLIVPMRGGFGKAPISIADAYFDSKPFVNHASLNLMWNMGYSVSEAADDTNPFAFMPDSAAQKLTETRSLTTSQIPALVKNEANLILIVLESFTAKAIGHLGSPYNATPWLDSIASEGLAFTRCFAAGDRSDKGLAALVFGYPPFATGSLAQFPNKSLRLPSLARNLSQNGYTTQFYYGGDVNFANIGSMLYNAGFRRIISKSDLPANKHSAKWGTADEDLFLRLREDIDAASNPFFSMVFTLSSHEPFDVPSGFRRFAGTTTDSLFLNSIAYTDSCLGSFYQWFRQSEHWQNSLLVLVADHGKLFLGKPALEAESTYHIPLIITGGALKASPTQVEYTVSQLDLPASLSQQLCNQYTGFSFSSHLFDTRRAHDALYVFNGGFGHSTDSAAYVYYTQTQKTKTLRGTPSDALILTGKAFMQWHFASFLKP